MKDMDAPQQLCQCIRRKNVPVKKENYVCHGEEITAETCIWKAKQVETTERRCPFFGSVSDTRDSLADSFADMCSDVFDVYQALGLLRIFYIQQ